MNIKIKALAYFLIFLILLVEVAVEITLPVLLDSIDKNYDWRDTETPKPEFGYASYTIAAISACYGFFISTILCFLFGKYRNFVLNRWILIVSMFTSIHFFLTPYVSSPTRNSPIIQALLLNFYIPLTAITRLLVLRKIPSLRRFICMMVILIALIISSIPEINPCILSGCNKNETNANLLEYNFAPIAWNIAYILFCVSPDIFTNVLIEKIIEQPLTSEINPENGDNDRIRRQHSSSSNMLLEQNDIFYVNAFMSGVNLIVTISMFWVDLIPGFGYSKNMPSFLTIVRSTAECISCKYGCDYYILLFLLIYSASVSCVNTFCSLLLMIGEGSTLLAIIINMVTPLTVLFFMLFSNNPLPIHWAPSFRLENIFSIVAVVVILPAVTIYNYYDEELSFDWVKSKLSIFNIHFYHIEIHKKADIVEM